MDPWRSRHRERRGRARRLNARSRSARGRWTGQHPHDHSARLHRRRDEKCDQQSWLTASTSTAQNTRATHARRGECGVGRCLGDCLEGVMRRNGAGGGRWPGQIRWSPRRQRASQIVNVAECRDHKAAAAQVSSKISPAAGRAGSAAAGRAADGSFPTERNHRVSQRAGLHRTLAPRLLFASCATGRVAGRPRVVSDPIPALLFRVRRSGCLLDPG